MIYDLSPPIRESLAVWPGDVPARREILFELSRGDPVTLSALRATVHLGTHADAPSHYGLKGESIESRSLDFYLGLCQVIDVALGRGKIAEPRDIKTPIQAPRLLVRTGTFPDSTRFNEDFAALSPGFVDHCSAQGVRLIGIDTPSVDPFSSKMLPAHKRFLANDMAILEGLVLNGVPEGLYELIALPLRLEGFDASPVRAILRTIDERGRPT